MRTIPAAMKNYLAERVTYFVYCWKITLFHGTVLGFTNHQQDLTIDGVVYASEEGVSKTAITFSERLAPDNIDITGVIEEIQMLKQEIINGRFDGADIDIFVVNYQDLAAGKIDLASYNVGDIQAKRNEYTFNVRGQSQKYKQTFGRTYTNSCYLDFGEAKCGVTPTSAAGTVTSVASQRKFTASAMGQAAGFFDFGLFVWDAGGNKGVNSRVKAFTSGGVIELGLPMLAPIAIGDTFTVQNGCGKLISHCKGYSNIVNYRGFNHIPGIDKIQRRV
jgi:uncharacterized phage protein (TIGR02218 family)